jgi:hypothetical protein
MEPAGGEGRAELNRNACSQSPVIAHMVQRSVTVMLRFFFLPVQPAQMPLKGLGPRAGFLPHASRRLGVLGSLPVHGDDFPLILLWEKGQPFGFFAVLLIFGEIRHREIDAFVLTSKAEGKERSSIARVPALGFP